MFRLTRQVKEETAEEVRREVESRIDDFLEEFEPRNFFNRKRSLRELFKWSRQVWENKCQLEKSVLEHKRALERANNQILSLSDTLRNRDEALSNERALRERRERELNSRDDHWTTILGETTSKHETMLHTLKAEHEGTVGRMRNDHDSTLGRLRKDIMVNQADSRAWTDEKLKARFGELRQAINTLASPHSAAMQAIRGKCGHLDQDGFLGRHGAQWSHFLVQSVVWHILGEQFFSTSWGFGALGPDEGRRALLRIYGAWRALLEGTEDTSETTYDAVFAHDSEANKWRSATFESLMASVLAGGQAGGRSLGALYEENARNAADRITSVFAAAPGGPESAAAAAAAVVADKISRLCSELALQFGVQPAPMRLIFPAHDQLVEIGKEFTDCIDGNINRGERVGVDIVVSPGLTRVGAGKGNATVTVHLCPAEIFPLD